MQLHLHLHEASLLAFDIDGTLTDGTTWWAGPDYGWQQRYSVRDGEALLRLATRMPVVPLSRNKTLAARTRMQGLGLALDWVGTSDKLASLQEICERHGGDPARVCFVGDGLDDAAVFERVGLGCAVRDAHPRALAAARFVLESPGGHRVIEELESRMQEPLP
jgi:3-deoxy-D-manno-octulosonate 8-phosphate phosphatase (KDO 8-P phosphatase)